jgi:hypothetical protein
MFGLLLTGFMIANEPVPPTDVRASERELTQLFEQARRDFEQRHAELGLVGAALRGDQDAAPAAAQPRQRAETLEDAKAKAKTVEPARHRASR